MFDDVNIYKHSGRWGNAWLVLPLFGLVGSVVGSILYAYADVYIPVAGYFSVVLTAGFAFVVGVAASMGASVGKCRSVRLTHFLGFFVGVFALYCSWVAFVYVLFRRDLPDEVDIGLLQLFMSPAALWQFILLINESGWYSISSTTPTGSTLWAFWAIEAVIVIGGASFAAGTGIAGEVFCETCSRWCDATKGFMCLALTGEEDLPRRLAEGSVEAIASFPPAGADEMQLIRVDVNRCPSCADHTTWQAALVTKELTKEGKLEEQEHFLTGKGLISSAQFQALMELAERTPISQPPNNDIESPINASKTLDFSDDDDAL